MYYFAVFYVIICDFYKAILEWKLLQSKSYAIFFSVFCSFNFVIYFKFEFIIYTLQFIHSFVINGVMMTFC